MLQRGSGGEGKGVGAGEPGWGCRAVLMPPPRDQVTQGPSSSPHEGTLPSPTPRRGGASDSQRLPAQRLSATALTDLDTRPSQGQVAFGQKTPHLWSRSLSAPPPPTSSHPATGHLSLSRPFSLSLVSYENPPPVFSLESGLPLQGMGCSPARAIPAPTPPPPRPQPLYMVLV